MYDVLSVSRGLVYSTVKYLFRAPSGTFYIGQTTIQKVAYFISIVCLFSTRAVVGIDTNKEFVRLLLKR